MQKNKAHCPEATILRNTWKRKVESENLAKFLKRNEILQNKRATKFAKKISFRNFRFKGRTKVSAKIGQSSSSRWMEYVRLLFIYIKARNQTYSKKLPLLQPWQERFYNLRPEMGNIFLCITVQDFLDSMVICIFRQKITQNELLRIWWRHILETMAIFYIFYGITWKIILYFMRRFRLC